MICNFEVFPDSCNWHKLGSTNLLFQKGKINWRGVEGVAPEMDKNVLEVFRNDPNSLRVSYGSLNSTLGFINSSGCMSPSYFSINVVPYTACQCLYVMNNDTVIINCLCRGFTSPLFSQLTDYAKTIVGGKQVVFAWLAEILYRFGWRVPSLRDVHGQAKDFFFFRDILYNWIQAAGRFRESDADEQRILPLVTWLRSAKPPSVISNACKCK